MPYDNIKSHRKPGFHPLFRRYIFRKTTEGAGVKFAPLSRFRAKFANSRQIFRDQNFRTVKFRTATLFKNYNVQKFWKLMYASLNYSVGVETDFHE